MTPELIKALTEMGKAFLPYALGALFIFLVYRRGRG